MTIGAFRLRRDFMSTHEPKFMPSNTRTTVVVRRRHVVALLSVLLQACSANTQPVPIELTGGEVSPAAQNSSLLEAHVQFHVLPADDVRIEAGTDGARLTDLIADPHVVFATNGGIFERPEAATGLLISGGKELHPINLEGGAGNFFLKPNGIVLRTDDGRWRIVESTEFQGVRSKHTVTDATQSGPLLLRKGSIHPAIQPSSPNKLLRNAACVDADGRLHLLMTRGGGSFYDVTRSAIDMGCTDALYLDGVISSVLHNGKIEPPENRGQHYASMIVVRRR
jgi:uncharacterized protein YigE (DUF2233 family)